MNADCRAEAARALADVALRGMSLRAAGKRPLERLGDPRDRALCSALLHDGARWWLRFDAALEHLLSQPLRRREPEVHALLVLGLVQLEILQLPAYAAVAATVQASRALQRPRLAGLVNAVLRRWQRERSGLIATLDAKACTRYAQPRWLLDRIQRDWPEQAAAILAAANQTPPLTLRVNRRQGSRASLLAHWREVLPELEAQPHSWLPDAILLAHSQDVTRLPGFAQGRFSVQDGAAQIACAMAELKPGLRILDACAAPGGKACHLLERAELELTALEVDAARSRQIQDNLERLRLNARVCCGDAGAPAKWWDGEPYDRILLDAPCSASGVIRRRPDVRLHRRESDMPALVAQQQRILAGLWPLLKTGGRLIYITCSILREENEAVMADFLSRHPAARAAPITLPAGQTAGVGWQLLPGQDQLDGLYYAVIEKA